MSGDPSAPDPRELAWLREAFASRPERPFESGEPALEPETLWAAARGELDPEQTAAIVDRLQHDPELAREWRLAIELTSPNEGAEPIAASANDHRYPRASRWAAGLLGALAIAAVALFVLDREDPGLEREREPVLRASNHEPALTTDIADGATFPRSRLELRWSALAEADHYELRVTTSELDPIEQKLDLRTTSTTIPSEALAKVAAKGALLWQVTAVLPDGTRVESPAWRVVIE